MIVVFGIKITDCICKACRPGPDPGSAVRVLQCSDSLLCDWLTWQLRSLPFGGVTAPTTLV